MGSTLHLGVLPLLRREQNPGLVESPTVIGLAAGKFIGRERSLSRGCLQLCWFRHREGNGCFACGGGRCGMVEMSLVDAGRVHEVLPQRNQRSWATLMSGYVKRGQATEALSVYDEMVEEGVKPSRYAFLPALKACGALGELGTGKKIHEHMVQSGDDTDLFVATSLLDMYAKCGSMVDACCVFDKLAHRDVVAWNAMILGYAQKEEGGLALDLYARMQNEGVAPNERTFVSMLKACTSLATLEHGREVGGRLLKIECLEKGRAIHSQVVKLGFDSDVFVGTMLVDMYAKCGSMVDAQAVFDQLPHRDIVSWNAMVAGYAQNDEGGLALELYAWMQQEGFWPNKRTFVGVLKACCGLATLDEGSGKLLKVECLEKGRAIHSQVVKCGFESDAFVGTMLVDMYAKCGSMVDARHVFEELPHRDVVSWTAMILGYAQKEESCGLAVEFYAQMQQEGMAPNERTFVGVLKALSSLATMEEGVQVDGKCVKPGSLEKGRFIYSQILKCGFESNSFVGNALMDMYAKCGSMMDALVVFDKLAHRDVIAWTIMIMGYAQEEGGEVALKLYAQMQEEGVAPSERTFIGVLKACSSLTALENETEVDGGFVKLQCLQKGRAIDYQLKSKGCFQSNVFIGTTLVDLYAKCGSMVDAWDVFRRLPHCDVATWNAMILGYGELGDSDEAFKLYTQMQEHGLAPNSGTFVSILKVCGRSAALETGKKIHAQIRANGLEVTDIIVGNALIDMYGKCGSMVGAQQVFDAMPSRNVVTWSALISGYARQGEIELVFHLFETMRQEGIQADGVACLSVLIACSHAGLIDKGHDYFDAMSTKYGLTPTIQHYNCIVDLLGRAGQMDAALAMVEQMPFQPNFVTWMTVLGGCQKWRNVKVGRHAFECAVKLDGKQAGPYALMSNIYADAQMWKDRDEIQAMKEKERAWKKPGQSWWTDADGAVHTFVAGDENHPHCQHIYAELKDLSVKMDAGSAKLEDAF